MRPSSIWTRVNGRLEWIAGPAEIATDGIPPKPVENAHPVGFWVPSHVFRSPDGRILLAQWSGACETQTAYLVYVASGKVRGIFVEHAPGVTFMHQATTHGWTADGRARVRLASPIYAKLPRVGVLAPAGMYDIDPVTQQRTLERRLRGSPRC
jgi:hypothetical protein